MFKRTFKVVFRPSKNSFLLLPENYFKVISTYDTGCLSLQFAGHVHYASWAPYAGAVKETEIGINARVAKEIGLHENDLVKCVLIGDVMPLKSVFVTPVSPKDWEIIELSSEKISNNMLDQTRIVNSTQILIVWINKSMQVAVTVDRLKPNLSYGRIDHNTELIVAPNIYKGLNIGDFDKSEKANDGDSNKLLRRRTIASIVPNEDMTQQEGGDNNLMRSHTSGNIQELSHSEMLAKAKRADNFKKLLKDLRRENANFFEFRVIKGEWREKAQISDVFVIEASLPDSMDLNVIYAMRTAGERDYFVKVKLLEEGDMPHHHPTIEINAQLMELLNMSELERVVLKPKSMVMNFVEKIELFANRKTHYKIIENAFKRFIIEKTQTAPMLLNQNEVVRLEEGLIVSVDIEPEHFSYCIIDAQFLKESKIYAADLVRTVNDVLTVESKEESPLSASTDLIKLPAFDAIVGELVSDLKMSLCVDEESAVVRQRNILIAGGAGSGRTVLVERVLDQIMRKPFYCFFDIFYCTRSKGRKIESVQKDLRCIFNTCLQKAPSIVVLENLDVLSRAAGEQATPDGEYYSRMADSIHQLIVQYTMTHAIAVIATVSELQTLNKRLYSARGRHLFQTVVHVPHLECGDREIMLREMCSNINTRDLDYTKFANLTEGYKIRDLKEFVERAIFYAYRQDKTNPVLTNEDLLDSLENTNAYCLYGVESHHKSSNNAELTVKEVPGLQPVVEVLEEVIMWPSMYPKLFQNSPLRNQAGVLLFGAPGTGKTFLVSKIAHSWNLRTISVKGPELLAKYIGQSEENVRNLFNRARSAKPCVLFFDEFDSLAPKRGHDSTGVTDRVVNQLLTELDGVQGLSGVTVIAATSRPELIDPALLRAGRIDRIVECPMPDAEARLRIFQLLSTSLTLDESVKFEWFAPKTQNYTGADIKSILTTANMNAVQEALDKCSGDEQLPERVLVRQAHLMAAFQTTRPSLSAADVARYQKTYARFTKKEKPTRDFVAKRATLA